MHNYIPYILYIIEKLPILIDFRYHAVYDADTNVTSKSSAHDARKREGNMKKEELAARLKNACACVAESEALLTEIDSKFGDADHGLTMSKIAAAITQAVDESQGGIQNMLDDAAMAVMELNGGSAVPLWNTWLDGMQEAAPEGDTVDIAGIQAIFAGGFAEIDDMSGAKVGDKTMMDALIPASDAIAAFTGSDEQALFAAAAQAAAKGAADTKQFVSKFGRAKSYGEKTIGTPDAGASSMAYFFQGLAQP